MKAVSMPFLFPTTTTILVCYFCIIVVVWNHQIDLTTSFVSQHTKMNNNYVNHYNNYNTNNNNNNYNNRRIQQIRSSSVSSLSFLSLSPPSRQQQDQRIVTTTISPPPTYPITTSRSRRTSSLSSSSIFLSSSLYSAPPLVPSHYLLSRRRLSYVRQIHRNHNHDDKSQHPFQTLLLLHAEKSNNNDDNDMNQNDINNNNEEGSVPQQLQRKRDLIMEWVYGRSTSGSGSGSSSSTSRSKNMVRPIRLDGTIVEPYNQPTGSVQQQQSPSSSSSRSNTNTNIGFKAKFNVILFTVTDILGLSDGSDTNDESTQQQQGKDKKDSDTTTNKNTKQKTSFGNVDDSIFEKDQRRIIDTYNVMLSSMLRQVADERDKQQEQEEQQKQRATTTSTNGNNNLNTRIPENAEALIRSILQQEMKNEIKKMKEQVSIELLNQYAKQQMEQFLMNSKNNYSTVIVTPTTTTSTTTTNQQQTQGQQQQTQPVSYSSSTTNTNNIPNPEKVQKLMDDSEKEYRREEKIRLELEEFLKYEQQAILRNQEETLSSKSRTTTTTSSSSTTTNNNNNNNDSNNDTIDKNKEEKIEDLDQWVLDRFQEMIDSNNNKEGGEVVVDNLEMNLEELTKRIQNKVDKSATIVTFDPTTTSGRTILVSTSEASNFDNLKEWQMYRSIATRLENLYTNASSSSNNNNNNTTTTTTTNTNTPPLLTKQQIENEKQSKIISLLQSWKEYVIKEEQSRKVSGLSSLGPKLPFEWQEADLEERLREKEYNEEYNDSAIRSTTLFGIDTNMESGIETTNNNILQRKSKNDIRKELNKMSINAMESLLQSKSIDDKRKDNIRKEIDFLKSTLEGIDYLDLDTPETDSDTDNNNNVENDTYKNVKTNSKMNQSIDTRNLFKSYSSEEFDDIISSSDILNDYDEIDFSGSLPSEGYGGSTSSSSTLSPSPSLSSITTTTTKKSQDDPNPPPFYGSSSNSETTKSNQQELPKPNTPFFNDEDDDKSYTSVDFNLGSMEEQKLEAMYRRAGVKTAMERASIKKQYEEFKEFEKSKRDQSGLSGYETTSDEDGQQSSINEKNVPGEESLKYNISEVLLEGGDFDAEKVLASIGPRPTRTKNINKSSPTASDGSATGTTEGKVSKDDVLESRYRALSAVGGGRYKDDPEANAKQLNAFEEYAALENKMRESLDSNEIGKDLNIEVPESSSSSEGVFDDVKYAEEVIASLGARPVPKRTRTIQDEGSYSDSGGVLSSMEVNDDDEEDDDDDEVEDEDNKDLSTLSNSEEASNMPDWLRKEQEEAGAKNVGGRSSRRKTFLGSDIDDVFDDTDYEHNMRQLAEYERRRAGGVRPMGIDITEVLGSRRNGVFQSDDYADYKYGQTEYDQQRKGQTGWGYARRRSDLLEYVELELSEVNSLMEHKDSVYSTGTSPYLPRINKPFKDFGAIFRLEGVLIDITGLQLQAWSKVANEYKFQLPTLQEARQAAVIRPEVAVKEIFFWSDDFLECKNIAVAHQKAFKEAFTAWMKENNLSAPVSSTSGGTNIATRNIALGSEVIEKTTNDEPFQISSFVNESEKIEIIAKAWARTAEVIGVSKPARDSVLASVVLTPDIAVQQIFRWSMDPIEVDSIVQVYRREVRLIYEMSKSDTIGGRNADPTSEMMTTTSNTAAVVSKSRTNKPMTQNDAMELHHQAWIHVATKYNFEVPLPEESIASFVINDPEITVRKGFGWTEDNDKVKEVVLEFRTKVADLMGSNSNAAVQSPAVKDNTLSSGTTLLEGTLGPNADEVFLTARDAWIATSKHFGFSQPDDEQVQFALAVGPEEAIITGFQWTTDPNVIFKTLNLYRNELSKGRAKWKGVKKDPMVKVELKLKRTASGVSSKGPSDDDLFTAVLESWTDTAKKFGFSSPDNEQVQFALSVGPEEAVMHGFEWSYEPKQVNEYVEYYRQEIFKRRAKWQPGSTTSSTSTSSNGGGKSGESSFPLVSIIPGAADWIQSLLNNEMRCGVISYLDREQVDTLLQYSGLDKLISIENRVSSSNGYRNDDDQLLGMSLRLERRPDHCALFDCTPYSSIAAHKVEMQSVNMIGPYPRYELLSSDSTSGSFTDLTAMNIRRLFGERIYDQPLQETQSNIQRIIKTKTITRFSDDE